MLTNFEFKIQNEKNWLKFCIFAESILYYLIL